jgi:hypothetical protein
VLTEEDDGLEVSGGAELFIRAADLLAHNAPISIAVLRNLYCTAIIISNEIAVALAGLLADLAFGECLVGSKGDEGFVGLGRGGLAGSLTLRREPLVTTEAGSPSISVDCVGV